MIRSIILLLISSLSFADFDSVETKIRSIYELVLANKNEPSKYISTHRALITNISLKKMKDGKPHEKKKNKPGKKKEYKGLSIESV